MSGQPLRTWFQRMILPCAAGSHSFLSSATVIDVAHVFFGCTTMARPSYATGSSMNCDARLRARLGFDRPDRARRVGDVDLVAAELLEAAARARDADRDAGAGVRLLEFFGHRFRDRIDGAGAIDRDDGRVTGLASPAAPLSVVEPPPHATSPTVKGKQL